VGIAFASQGCGESWGKVRINPGRSADASIAAPLALLPFGRNARFEIGAAHVFIRERWVAFAVRAGALLVTLASIFFLAGERTIGQPNGLAATACLAFNLILAAAAFGLSFTRRFNSLWQPATFCMAVAFVLNATMLGVAAGEAPMLFATLLLAMAYSGALLPWPSWWQAGFNLISLGAWSVVVLTGAIEGASSPYRWILLVIAAALAEVTNLIRTREAGEQEYVRRLIANSEAKLRKVFEASPDAIAVIRISDGVLLDMNPQFEAASSPRDELIGRTNTDRALWVDPAQRREFFRILAARGRVHNMEVDFRTRDGRILPSLVSAVTVELDGEPCVVSVARSITRLKRTEQALVRAREQAMAASRAKSDFLSSMSHEIRTPLHAIIGMTDLLLETPLSHVQRHHLARMADNGKSLARIIDDILDLARIESGRMALEEAPLDLAEVIDAVIGTLGVRAHEKGLELLATIAPEVPSALLGDPLRLRQILVNLVGNATKFTERGRVTLGVEREGGGEEAGAVALHFSVADTGIGITPDEHEQIFAPFSQADSSTTRKYGGTGLGLAIVKRLVDLMQGRVWVESEVGRGSTFHFVARFKIDAAAERAPGRPSGLRCDHSGAAGRLSILLADDSADNRSLISACLKDTPYQIDEVADGAAALARFMAASYDLVLLDIQMPVMDGHQAAAAMRACERRQGRPHTPIIALTAAAHSESIARSFEAGCDEAVSKPVRKAILLDAIRRVTSAPAQTHAQA
jgi:PAS domain S-box-containing protein